MHNNPENTRRMTPQEIVAMRENDRQEKERRMPLFEKVKNYNTAVKSGYKTFENIISSHALEGIVIVIIQCMLEIKMIANSGMVGAFFATYGNLMQIRGNEFGHFYQDDLEDYHLDVDQGWYQTKLGYLVLPLVIAATIIMVGGVVSVPIMEANPIQLVSSGMFLVAVPKLVGDCVKHGGVKEAYNSVSKQFNDAFYGGEDKLTRLSRFFLGVTCVAGLVSGLLAVPYSINVLLDVYSIVPMIPMLKLVLFRVMFATRMICMAERLFRAKPTKLIYLPMSGRGRKVGFTCHIRHVNDQLQEEGDDKLWLLTKDNYTAFDWNGLTLGMRMGLPG